MFSDVLLFAVFCGREIICAKNEQKERKRNNERKEIKEKDEEEKKIREMYLSLFIET